MSSGVGGSQLTGNSGQLTTIPNPGAGSTIGSNGQVFLSDGSPFLFNGQQVFAGANGTFTTTAPSSTSAATTQSQGMQPNFQVSNAYVGNPLYSPSQTGAALMGQQMMVNPNPSQQPISSQSGIYSGPQTPTLSSGVPAIPQGPWSHVPGLIGGMAPQGQVGPASLAANPQNVWNVPKPSTTTITPTAPYGGVSSATSSPSPFATPPAAPSINYSSTGLPPPTAPTPNMQPQSRALGLTPLNAASNYVTNATTPGTSAGFLALGAATKHMAAGGRVRRDQQNQPPPPIQVGPQPGPINMPAAGPPPNIPVGTPINPAAFAPGGQYGAPLAPGMAPPPVAPPVNNPNFQMPPGFAPGQNLLGALPGGNVPPPNPMGPGPQFMGQLPGGMIGPQATPGIKLRQSGGPIQKDDDETYFGGQPSPAASPTPTPKTSPTPKPTPVPPAKWQTTIAGQPVEDQPYQQKAAGGKVDTDTVPAMLTPGEYVINKDAAENIGKEKLDELNQKGKSKKLGDGLYPQHLQAGGDVQDLDNLSTNYAMNQFNAAQQTMLQAMLRQNPQTQYSQNEPSSSSNPLFQRFLTLKQQFVANRLGTQYGPGQQAAAQKKAQSSVPQTIGAQTTATQRPSTPQQGTPQQGFPGVGGNMYGGGGGGMPPGTLPGQGTYLPAAQQTPNYPGNMTQWLAQFGHTPQGQTWLANNQNNPAAQAYIRSLSSATGPGSPLYGNPQGMQVGPANPGIASPTATAQTAGDYAAGAANPASGTMNLGQAPAAPNFNVAATIAGAGQNVAQAWSNYGKSVGSWNPIPAGSWANAMYYENPEIAHYYQYMQPFQEYQIV